MVLGYQKWSAEDDKLRNIFPDGDYPGLIQSITKMLTKAGKFDKNGNPIPQKQMLELDLLIADENGRERKLKDWVLLEGEMSWKFRHLCEACGKLEDYENENTDLQKLIQSLVNKIPVIRIKSRKQNDQNGMEVLRNTVADYLTAPVSCNSNFLDDDIPI